MPNLTVEPLTLSIAQQQSRGLELGNLPRNGQVVQARVVAMLDGGMARLALMGQTIDVNAPSTFQSGMSISVAILREGGNLKLILQQDPQAALQQAGVANAPALKADAAGLLPAAAKAAIIGALLDSLNPQAAAVAETARSPMQNPPAGDPATPAAEAAPQPAVQQAQHGPGTSHVIAPSPAPDQQLASPSIPSSGHTAQQAEALPSASASSVAAQNSAQAILVPFQLPQLAQPLMLRVEQQEEDGADGSGKPTAGRTWTVTVSLDAGALGLIQIGIGFRQGEVSVRLTSKDAQGTAHLGAWLPELKKSLEQADFVTGELSAVLTQQADAAVQGPSHTV